MTGASSCRICGSKCESRCMACYSVFYCGPQHQKEDWKNHKVNCKKPYKIVDDPNAGRCMVASRNLEPGDVILKEKCVVHGPGFDDKIPLCLGCYAPLNESNFHPCKKCKGPLCGSPCEESPIHKDNECGEIKQCPLGLYNDFQNGTVIKRHKPSLKHANYKLILPIRVLALKKRGDLKSWKSVMNLQSHTDSLSGTDREKQVENYVVKMAGQYKLGGDAHSENLHSICGIFDTNGFELATTKNNNSVSFSGLFPLASMMKHSCYKNTRIMFSSKDHSMTIMARTQISKGEFIHHSYARTFNTTTLRRVMLFRGKHFGCECVRCLDPTEMGAYTSALKCQNCEKVGFILPENPIDLESSWKCNKCEAQVPGAQIHLMERNLSLELEGIDKMDLNSLESFIDKYKGVLHSQHAFMIKAKQLVSVGIGRFSGYNQTTLPLLRKKVDYCRQVLKVNRILDNGIAPKIGLACYELSIALQKLCEIKVWSKKDAIDRILIYKEAQKLSQEASEILSYEDPNSDYGQLSVMAQKDVLSLEKMIKN